MYHFYPFLCTKKEFEKQIYFIYVNDIASKNPFYKTKLGIKCLNQPVDLLVIDEHMQFNTIQYL